MSFDNKPYSHKPMPATRRQASEKELMAAYLFSDQMMVKEVGRQKYENKKQYKNKRYR